MKVVKTLSLSDGLSVIDTGLACFAIDLELTFYSFDVDLKVQLSHSAYYHFLGLFVDVCEEGGVFSSEF